MVPGASRASSFHSPPFASSERKDRTLSITRIAVHDRRNTHSRIEAAVSAVSSMCDGTGKIRFRFN